MIENMKEREENTSREKNGEKKGGRGKKGQRIQRESILDFENDS